MPNDDQNTKTEAEAKPLDGGGFAAPPCSTILADTPLTDALRAEHRGPWEEVGEELCRAMIRHANDLERENARLRAKLKHIK
jgi:hypothetical protein